jgi:hypothetical protein
MQFLAVTDVKAKLWPLGELWLVGWVNRSNETWIKNDPLVFNLFG